MFRTRALALLTGAVLLLVAGRLAGADEKKGVDVATKIDKAARGYVGQEFDIELKLISANGSSVVRKMNGKMREDGADDKMLLTITFPLDQKGTRLLSWGHRGSDDDQWLYLPSIKRVKRISATNRSGSFLGSEFAYEDLVNPWDAGRYKHNYVADKTVASHDTWVCERTPKDKNSGYSKEIVWYDKKYMSALRIEYYDRKGKLLKTADFKDYKKYGNKWYADRIVVVNRQTGKSSEMTWKKRSVNVSQSDDAFSPERIQY
jgi:hypothetical protein